MLINDLGTSPAIFKKKKKKSLSLFAAAKSIDGFTRN
jgi:hypothetical protein